MARDIDEIRKSMKRLLTKADVEETEATSPTSGKYVVVNGAETYNEADIDEFWNNLRDIRAYKEESSIGRLLDHGELNPEALNTLGRALAVFGIKGSDALGIHGREEAEEEYGNREAAAKYLTDRLFEENLIPEQTEVQLKGMYAAIMGSLADHSTKPLDEFTGTFEEGYIRPKNPLKNESPFGEVKQGEGQPPKRQGGEQNEEQLMQTIQDWFEEENLRAHDFRSASSLKNAARQLAREIQGR